MMTIQFLNDHVHGLLTQFYPNGRKRQEQSYVEGIIYGDCRVWTADGKLLKKLSHILGQLHGRQENYFLNGKPALVARFQSGENHGTSMMLRLNGELSNSQTFDMGRVVDEEFGDARSETDKRANLLSIAEQARDFSEFWKDKTFDSKILAAVESIADSAVELQENWTTETKLADAGTMFPFPVKVVKTATSESGFGVLKAMDQEDNIFSVWSLLNGIHHGRSIHYWPNGNTHGDMVFSCGSAHGDFIFFDRQERRLTKGAVVFTYVIGEPARNRSRLA